MIFELINTVVQITLFGGAIFIGLNFLKSKKFNSAKTDIQNLQARLSQLRLALKSKVKKKSNVFRATTKTPIIEGDLFDQTVKQLNDVKFESSSDFQEYFEISRQLVRIMQLENKDEAPTSHMIENNYMSSDFKTEMEIVRIIKDMTDLSAKINSRVDEHNRTGVGQKLSRVDGLVFPSMTEINRIFNSDTTETVESTNKAS